MSFYVLKKKWDSTSLLNVAISGRHVQGDADRCADCDATVSLLKWLAPYQVEFELRSATFADVAFEMGGDLVVSRRFVELIETYRLTGLTGFEPVEILKVKPLRRARAVVPAYLHVEVNRTDALVDVTASEVQWLKPPTCQRCLTANIMRWQRVQLIPDTWTGEDIFLARGLPSTILVTPRFKALCEEFEITNAEFIPATQYAHDYYPGLVDPAELDRFRGPGEDETG